MFSLSTVRLGQCRLLPKEMIIPSGVNLVNTDFRERRRNHLDHLYFYPNTHHIDIDKDRLRQSSQVTFGDLVKKKELFKEHKKNHGPKQNDNLKHEKEVNSHNVFKLDSIQLNRANKDQRSSKTNYNSTETPKATYIWPSDLSRGVCYFKSSSTEFNGSTEGRKGPNLEKVAHQLTFDLVNIFLNSPDWNMYHTNLVVEDNIRGKRFEGLDKYVIFVNLLKITAHVRFVYVRFHILNITKNKENNTIKIRWRIVGLGMVRLILRYFPDRLWMAGNMDCNAPSWYDGVSTFHVGDDDKIYKHVIDQMDRDESPVEETLSQKITKRLKPLAAPSPI